MHFSTPASAAIAALSCLTLACSSGVGALFEDSLPDGGAEAGSSGGGAGSDGGPGENVDEASADGSPAMLDATSDSSRDAPAPEAGRDTGPSCSAAACGDHAHCAPEAAACQCDPGYVANGPRCEEVAGALNGQRVEVPCLKAQKNDALCQSVTESPVAKRVMGGNRGTTYLVTLHLRGIIELKAYTGGTTSGTFSEGGTPRDDGWNVYRLEISDPPKIYYL